MPKEKQLSFLRESKMPDRVRESIFVWKSLILLGSRIKRGMTVLTFAFSICVLSLLPSSAHAQQPADFSFSYLLSDQEAEDGDIIVSSQDGLVRATSIADNRMFGVLQINSLVVFKSADPNQKPVVNNGTAQVNVTTIGGSIKKGDFITSSTIAGKGQKLTDSGYTIGLALQDFDSEGVGKIPIAIKVDYTETTTAKSFNRLFTALNNTILSGLQTPDQFSDVIRYLAAGAAMFFSLVFGFITFSRSVPKGVEAIGRNPLAKNTIYISMLINIVFTLITAAIGIGVAVIILRL